MKQNRSIPQFCGSCRHFEWQQPKDELGEITINRSQNIVVPPQANVDSPWQLVLHPTRWVIYPPPPHSPRLAVLQSRRAGLTASHYTNYSSARRRTLIMASSRVEAVEAQSGQHLKQGSQVTF